MRTQVLAISALLSALGLLSMAGCSDVESGCRVDDDCRTGRICVDRTCVDDPNALNSENNTNNANSVNASNNGNNTNNANSFLDIGIEEDMGIAPTDMGMGADTGPLNDAGTADTGPDPVLGPQIRVVPNRLDFGNVPLNTAVDVPITVENYGDADLVVTAANFTTPTQSYVVTPAVDANAPVTIGAGSTQTFNVRFQPRVALQLDVRLRFESNDIDTPTVDVRVTGRGRTQALTSTCFFASPDTIDFGSVPIGTSATQTVTVGNCSTTQNTTLLSATVNNNGPVSVDSSALPLVLTPGQTASVDVNFAPTAAPDVRRLITFTSDAQLGTTEEVDVRGNGGGCVDIVARGEAEAEPDDRLRPGVIPVVLNDTVNLNANDFSSPSGVADATWKIDQAPMGSAASIVDPNALEAEFKPDVEGVYVLSVAGTDPVSNASSCGDATIRIVALRNTPRIRISTTWMAPHDVDLHLKRTNTRQFPAWGDPVNDLYFGNLVADWGVPNNPLDNGFHLGDDNDGFGPEVIYLTSLEPGWRYLVGLEFDRRSGANPPTVPVTVTLTDDAGSGAPREQTLTHTFLINQTGTYWVPWEINGTNGTVRVVDMTQ